MKLDKIYTRTGDDGQTAIIGGKLPKSDIRICAYGTVDELNALVGMLITYVSEDDIRFFLEDIQQDLFLVGTSLANVKSCKCPVDVEKIEKAIDAFDNPSLTGFVLPGGSRRAALSHVCRTVCRRAERCIFELSETVVVDDAVKRYVNRLSDYFFALSLKLNIIDNVSEKTWGNTCK